MVLTAVYEQDFRDCSYGFRPRRSAHQALEALWKGLMDVGGGWVLELDIRSFFDELDHVQLRAFLDQRVRDGVIRRAIHKWLKAGVMEEGNRWVPEAGSPQGGVISPILANVYLHEVLDVWFEDEVTPRLRGRAFLVRYADDAVMVFEEGDDARRVLEVLPKRFAKYGLRLHPEKTKLVDFRRPDPTGEEPRGGRGGRPETFDLLGFTHYWGLSRKRRWVVKRKTSRKRFARAVKAVETWCRRFRHWPVWWQHRKLVLKLQGHFAYFGITGNAEALSRLVHVVTRVWRKWLSRRSQRGAMSWSRFHEVLRRYPLPVPRVIHSVYRRGAKP
jgi:group II intron reverse transcriptase/maturase